MASSDQHHRRLAFQEAMELLPLSTADGGRRFMSRRGAWLPGLDLEELRSSFGSGQFRAHDAAFGGHVYSQSVLAVCKTVGEEDGGKENGASPGLHTIHGYFTSKGKHDRPFVYNVTVMTRGRSFVTARVDARQPLQPSAVLFGKPFPLADANMPLGPVCFMAVVSFVQPQPHSLGQDRQEPPVQKRFASILETRLPSRWDPSPPVDMNVILAVMGRRDIVGTFPIADMKKVEMGPYNEGRPLHEQRELILYRLLAPLPHETAVEADSHVLVHAYTADRNGLLMAANNLNFALNEKVASLSNTFVVHTNVESAVMAYHDGHGAGDDLGHWWVQEVCFPRAAAGRAIVMNKIWSPSGVHVATEYQDGICTAHEEAGLNASWKL
ncbi:acyl-thioesterase [Grosmannia clavigera kw1407]|uniref:Acyl-thioesterase n=1 Tax=Grosmannia clavigera (strain kw1407 / UAMH 11150) TaxID=655863 RepID=F0X8P0_GROCL|nr:acyl-thioesterase [Grosmannia clavigera kw1407]EFX05351.1 acyl-thioesterase [Grosmannia clavigera kw1407]